MLDRGFVAVMAASLLACGVTSIGIYAIAKHERWAREHSAYFVCFAAGVLISVSFLHMIPESFARSSSGPAYLLIGFFALYFVNRFVRVYVCDQQEDADLAEGVTPTLGIALHSFIDGVIYSVAFNVSVFTGVLAAIGMVLHEFPEGIVTFVLLERGGIGQRKAARYAFWAAAATTPMGALVAYPLFRGISDAALGAMLAASAGALVYVGAFDLLPAVEKERRRYSILALAAGVVVAVVIVLSKR
jgi:zinc and cadmium transporter